MKVGEIFFSLGLKPDASWGRVRGMVSNLRNQMRGMDGATGGALGRARRGLGMEGLGPEYSGGAFFGPGRKNDGSNRNINWATSAGDPFGGSKGGGGGGAGSGSGGGGKDPGPAPGFLKRLRSGVSDLNLFRRALYGTFAVQTIQKVAELSDSYTNMHNRLRVLTGSQEEAEKQYQKGREVAQATRSDVESTVEGFVRVKNATKEMGLGYDQTWQLMTSFQQALQMSGASTSEAASGMRQLTQALAKGKLDGDEFKSLAENMPNILTILQEATGKTEGQLRSMSEAGQLTRKVVVDAFTKMKSKIADDFGKTVPTVSQQFTQFKNEMINAMGEFGKAVNIAKIAQTVFAALTIVLKIIIGVFKAVFTVINKVNDAFRALWSAAMNGSDEALALLVGIGVVLAGAIIPSLISIGQMIVMTIIPALYRMAAAALASAGPYALIIAGVAAIAYGVIKLIKHWDDVKAAAQRAWEAVVDGFSAAFAFIAELPVIKQLIWLAEKLEVLTGLSLGGTVLGGGVDPAGGAVGRAAKAIQDAKNAGINTPVVNDPTAATGGKGKHSVSVGDTTVNIYANDVADAKRKFDKDALDRQNRHAAAALSR